MAVDGGARGGEEVGDLLDGALAGVVELLGECDLLRVETRSAATGAAAGASGGQPVACVGERSSENQTQNAEVGDGSSPWCPN